LTELRVSAILLVLETSQEASLGLQAWHAAGFQDEEPPRQSRGNPHEAGPIPPAAAESWFQRKEGESEVTGATNALAGELWLAAQAQPSREFISFVVPLLAFFAIFYFLLILPAQKRQKKVNEMLSALKTGDKVVTNGGIYGVIAGVEEKEGTVLLRIAEQVKIKVARNAIAGLQPEPKKEES
jgi:preprotein translocase subunit YajC